MKDGWDKVIAAQLDSRPDPAVDRHLLPLRAFAGQPCASLTLASPSLTRKYVLIRKESGVHAFTLTRSKNRDALLAAARDLLPEIRAAGDEIEQERRIPPRLVEKFLETGIWRMGYPPEVDILTRFEVVETIATADGSAGWCTMLAGGGGGGLPGVDIREMKELVGDHKAVVAGAVRPSGRAVPVEGGYRVSGKWPFVSGCHHATWYSAGCVVYDGDSPRLDEAGRPTVIYCYFPRDEGKIIDTWFTTGLRGTGSNDVEAADVFVPANRAFTLFSEGASAQDGMTPPLAAVPGLSLIFHTPVVLGIARHAIDTFVALTENKVGARGTPMRREAQVQAAIATAEALVGSSRSYVLEVLTDIFGAFDRREEPTFRQRALCRLAITNAHKACVQAVDLLYEYGGGSSSYAKNGLDRIFRDINTANQHIVADYKTYEFAGRMLMGMNPGEPMF